MSIVICECGMWLKPPDPDQGGFGRCPSCGRVVGADGKVQGAPDPDLVAARRTGGRRRRRPRRAPTTFPKRGKPLTLGQALGFPLIDGPGLVLLIFFPPFLTIMSVPVFDLVPFFEEGPRGGFIPLALLLLPFAMPLIVSFIFTSGYIMLFLAKVLTNGAMGRDDHPSFPLWDRNTIAEGLVRWSWAGIIGLVVGALPIRLYVELRGNLGPIDWIVIAVLAGLAAGYAQMGLAAAILRDHLYLAHPIAIARAIRGIGREYLGPWLLTAVAMMLTVAAWRWVLYYAPSVTVAALGLWAFWIFVLYEAMVIVHVVGWTCYRNAAGLGWFRREPRWSSWDRPGRIYSNS